jgi:acyl-CoA oxidase
MDDTMGEFLEDGHIDGEQAAEIRQEIFKLLSEIRPDAAALVDSFGLHDYFLNSALGAKDGDVYRRLYEEVQAAPFNRKHTPPGYAELLQPKLSRGNFGVSKL